VRDLMPQMIEAVDKCFAETRHRRASQRRQVDPVQRAHVANSAAAENYRSAPSSRTSASWKSPIRASSSSTRRKPKKKIPAVVEFVDIAGLVKGASQGEGLGNQFLSHIREVDRWCT